jgi:hypothetical protein
VNQHLSQQQIDEWLMGNRPAEVESHLRSCEVCEDALARVSEPLTMFGAAVRSWSEEHMGPLPVRAQARRRNAGWWRVGLAIATLWLAIAVPVYRHHQETQQAALTAVQDEALLQQVDRELSQSVPAPMEPLAKLMPNDLTR